MKKKKHGGKRKGAGRPTITDKKKQIRFSTRISRIKALGGEEKIKAHCMDSIERKYSSIKGKGK